MNILFLLSHYPGYGGIEKVSTYLSSFLATRGCKVALLSYGSNVYSLRNFTPDGVDLFYVPKELDYKCNENTQFVRECLKANDFDYIIYQDSYAPLEHVLKDISYPWNKKLIVVEHNTPLFAIKTINSYFYYDETWKFFIKRIIYYVPSLVKAYLQSRKRRRFLLDNCRRYVLLSESYRKEMRLIMGFQYDKKLLSITNPLTIPETDKVDYYENKKNQILFVGRMTNQKGFNLLVKVWKQFSKLKHDKWELVLLAAGTGKDELESIISKEKLENIRIDPPTPDIQHYYEESSILVMTSIYEGFPLVLAEAMSRGCVPIAFDSFSSVHDIIDSGKNGVLIQPYDIQKYAYELCRITTEHDYRAQMSACSIDTSKRFSLNKVGDMWIKLFSDLNIER